MPYHQTERGWGRSNWICRTQRISPARGNRGLTRTSALGDFLLCSVRRCNDVWLRQEPWTLTPVLIHASYASHFTIVSACTRPMLYQLSYPVMFSTSIVGELRTTGDPLPTPNGGPTVRHHASPHCVLGAALLSGTVRPQARLYGSPVGAGCWSRTNDLLLMRQTS